MLYELCSILPPLWQMLTLIIVYFICALTNHATFTKLISMSAHGYFNRV